MFDAPAAAPAPLPKVPSAIYGRFAPLPETEKRLVQCAFKVSPEMQARFERLTGSGHESASLVARWAAEIGLLVLEKAIRGESEAL